jgi:hypothetical protein
LITPAGYAQLLAELDSLRPTIVVHPEDEVGVREAVDQSDFQAKIEVTELAEPGQITIFRGLRWPVSDLGGV